MTLNDWERGNFESHITTVPRRSAVQPTPRKESGFSHHVYTDDITDYAGRIRLWKVRDYFQWNQLETEDGRRIITDSFEEWMKCNEYLWFARFNRHTGEKEGEFCRKCAKRGNDVYRWRLDQRLGWMEELEDVEFFNPKDRDVRGEKTKMLFVVLTYDTKRCSRRVAWENINNDWNRWITAVRRRCQGTVKHFKTFEAHGNGYPHVNAILLFEDDEFELSHRDKNGKFRILRKDKDWFGRLWHSYVDVQACYSTAVFGYLKKYMMKVHGKKDVEDVKGVNNERAKLTLALFWLFRKQSFSLSEGMRESIDDLIDGMHNSNSLPFQMTLEGESLYEFELIGVVTLAELRLKRKPPPNAGGRWAFELPISSMPERKRVRMLNSAQYRLSSFR